MVQVAEVVIMDPTGTPLPVLDAYSDCEPVTWESIPTSGSNPRRTNPTLHSLTHTPMDRDSGLNGR